MAEYDLDFACKLAEIANYVDGQNHWRHDARRATVYLARLSMEIAMKAMLELAGVPTPKIRARSHDLHKLLMDLGKCEVETKAASGTMEFVNAANVRSVVIDLGLAHVPIGEIIDAESQGISKYPHQIRYGSEVIDLDPGLVAEAALLLCKWAKAHWRSIRLSSAINMPAQTSE
ncbi:MAG: hypothetical protein IPG98_15515 [Burkholderiales bacterium]|nr:hypothetical protein [Burkholderiales bacterium]MBK8666999.1 hypothetical protein [Burkholderiales bacterium]